MVLQITNPAAAAAAQIDRADLVSWQGTAIAPQGALQCGKEEPMSSAVPEVALLHPPQKIESRRIVFLLAVRNRFLRDEDAGFVGAIAVRRAGSRDVASKDRHRPPRLSWVALGDEISKSNAR